MPYRFADDHRRVGSALEYLYDTYPVTAGTVAVRADAEGKTVMRKDVSDEEAVRILAAALLGRLSTLSLAEFDVNTRAQLDSTLKRFCG